MIKFSQTKYTSIRYFYVMFSKTLSIETFQNNFIKQLKTDNHEKINNLLHLFGAVWNCSNK